MKEEQLVSRQSSYVEKPIEELDGEEMERFKIAIGDFINNVRKIKESLCLIGKTEEMEIKLDHENLNLIITLRPDNKNLGSEYFKKVTEKIKPLLAHSEWGESSFLIDHVRGRLEIIINSSV